MGLILFAAAAVVELGLAAFDVITRSNHEKLRSVTRIAAFAVFLLLSVLQVIGWGWRYYALGAVLLLLAATGAVSLARKAGQLRPFRAGHVVLRAAALALLFFALTLPAIIFPEYEMVAASGEYPVVSTAYTYTDPDRIETFTDTGEHRKLNVELWYPQGADETYPLIVFSHGGISTRTSNESLYHELASHGYVVCSIDHTYHSLLTTDGAGNRILIDSAYMRELNEEDAKSDRQQSYEYYQKWMAVRAGDIGFVIDHIVSQAENGEAGEVYRLIDASKIGVMGHSLGGSAALCVGRDREDVGAVVALESPVVCDIEGVEDGEFALTGEVYPLPVLNVYSDSAWSHLAEWPQYAQNYRLLSDTQAAAFNVHIQGVGHFSLTDLALTSPFLTRMFNGFKSTTDAVYSLETINKVTLEFFDYYLKGKGAFALAGTYPGR